MGWERYDGTDYEVLLKVRGRGRRWDGMTPLHDITNPSTMTPMHYITNSSAMMSLHDITYPSTMTSLHLFVYDVIIVLSMTSLSFCLWCHYLFVYDVIIFPTMTLLCFVRFAVFETPLILIFYWFITGKHFYEVVVTDEGLCRVGWSTKQAILELGINISGVERVLIYPG